MIYRLYYFSISILQCTIPSKGSKWRHIRVHLAYFNIFHIYLYIYWYRVDGSYEHPPDKIQHRIASYFNLWKKRTFFVFVSLKISCWFFASVTCCNLTMYSKVPRNSCKLHYWCKIFNLCVCDKFVTSVTCCCLTIIQ